MKGRCAETGCRRFRVQDYELCPDHIPRCGAKVGNGVCGSRAMPGLSICGEHGAHLPRLENVADEARVRNGSALAARSHAILDRGMDELDQLREISATAHAAVQLLHAEMMSTACEHCGRSGNPRTMAAAMSTLEKWAARSESAAVSLRKLRLDTRFRRLAEDWVQVIADWLIQYVPEHRREAALRDIEKSKADVHKRIA